MLVERHDRSCWPIYAGLIAGTVWIANAVPRGFIPTLDQGYAIVVIQLPDGASLSRTDAVVQRASQDHARKRPGVHDAVAFAGLFRRDLHQRAPMRPRSSPGSSRSTSG